MTRQIIVLVGLFLCIGVQAEDSFRLLFVDVRTLHPVVRKPITFIPRRIIQKGDGEENPNMQFAKTISTDFRGEMILTKTLFKELCDSGVCDSKIDGYTSIVLCEEPIGGSKTEFFHKVIAFHALGTRDGPLRSHTFLSSGVLNTILLNPLGQ